MAKIVATFLSAFVISNFVVSAVDAGSELRSPLANNITEESAKKTLSRQIDWRQHKIVGGAEVKVGSVPFQVHLLNSGNPWCGGSILNTEWIITAAHCVVEIPASDFSVVAGVHNILKYDNVTQIKQVSALIIHEDFGCGNRGNDIALLKVSTPLILGTKQRAGAIPLVTHSILPGTPATVTGWGQTSPGGPSSDVLLGVTVPVVSDEYCRKAHEPTHKILDSMLCAGEAGKDACGDDSGSPLVVTVGGKTQLAGIVSWGVSCAQPEYPGVYTEISYFVQWIKDKMAEE